jgi:hypothetical protein
MRGRMKISMTIGLVVALAVLAWAVDCVEVDIESPASAQPGDVVTLSGELTNCGDAGNCWLEGSIEVNGLTIALGRRPIYLAAGETRSESVDVTLPPGVQPGTYTACVTATIGTAEDSDCTTMQITTGDRVPHRTTTPKKTRR